jgi:hypothetical protein
MLLSFSVEPLAGNLAIYLLGVVFVLLPLQTIWLLPVLGARAERIISNTNSAAAAPNPNNHLIFIAFETSPHSNLNTSNGGWQSLQKRSISLLRARMPILSKAVPRRSPTGCSPW